MTLSPLPTTSHYLPLEEMPFLYLFARELPLQVAMRGRSLQKKELPIIVIKGSGENRVVVGANRIAERMGVSCGMKGEIPERLCRSAIFLPHNEEGCRMVDEEMKREAERYSPLVYKGEIGEVGFNLRGCKRLWGSTVRVAEIFIERVKKRTGVSLSAGASNLQLPARVASRGAPSSSLFLVPPGMEKNFLLLFPVSCLPDLAPVKRKLREMGIRYLGDASLIPAPLLKSVLLEYGESILHLLDPEKNLHEKRKGVEVSMRLQASDETPLEEIVFRRALMCIEDALSILSRKGEMAESLKLEVEYTDGRHFSRIFKIRPGDSGFDPLPMVREFVKVLPERRVSVERVGAVLLPPPDDRPLLDLDMGSSLLSPLLKAIFRIRERFGREAISRG